MSESFTCQRPKCNKSVYAKVAYLGLYLCLDHVKELGDFDQYGKMDDHRHDKKRGLVTAMVVEAETEPVIVTEVVA